MTLRPSRIRQTLRARLPAGLLAVVLMGTLGGCALLREFQPSVAVEPMSPGEYIALQRGDILTTGKLSALTAQTLRVAGLDVDACATPALACIDALREVQGISDERRLSATAELWLQHAIALPAPAKPDKVTTTPAKPARIDPAQAAADAALAERRLQAWMEAGRHAYAYLFFTTRTPGERAFEDRQTQVRDWYNAAVQEATTQLFDARLGETPDSATVSRAQYAGWTLRIDLAGVRLPDGTATPKELLPASSLSFQGLRSTYRRDGFGAELVAVMDDDPVTLPPPTANGNADADADADTDTAARDAGNRNGRDTRARDQDDERDAFAAGNPRGPSARRHRREPPAWSEMPSPNMTVLFRYGGDDLASVLATREVQVSVHDPYVDSLVTLHGQQVPLAANFTAGYGLWLARSGFNRQSLRTLFGRAQGIEHPHLYLMQPYDPDRRIILMLHGLASSPEAWVNVANELQGDEALRREFQIWQVYYPTNMPVVFNHAQIRRLVSSALAHFDPQHQAAASRDIVLVGHSMGGMIARLMVSSSDQQLWNALLGEFDIPPDRLARIRPRLDPMLRFQPFPGVERAVFIATPHRGTAVAGHRVGRWISRLVRLPLTLLENFDDVLQTLAGATSKSADGKPAGGIPNSIDNLDGSDPFVQAAADLPISPAVRYHSIIAQLKPGTPLEASDDGLVPYPSAHLAGAVSEKVIVSGHSVQETAPAILELRRILHEDLRQGTGDTRDAATPQDVPGQP